MIFLRVGTGGSHSGGISGAGPAANAAVTTVALDLTPSIPAGATTPLAGNNQGVSWNAGLPTFLTATPVVVPVEVRSNAGQVNITGEVTAPLTSGGNTIPMSSVVISSSDAGNLPAPVLPDAGTGAPVNVATGGSGTAAAPTLLTYRTAEWSFGFTPTASLSPGSYSGSVTFTATSLYKQVRHRPPAQPIDPHHAAQWQASAKPPLARRLASQGAAHGAREGRPPLRPAATTPTAAGP